VSDRIELLRQRLVAWYRQGCPWMAEPTLGAFRASPGGATREIQELVDALISRYGAAMPLKDLRLSHLLDLQ
jgi:hypothetical protein